MVSTLINKSTIPCITAAGAEVKSWLLTAEESNCCVLLTLTEHMSITRRNTLNMVRLCLCVLTKFFFSKTQRPKFREWCWNIHGWPCYGAPLPQRISKCWRIANDLEKKNTGNMSLSQTGLSTPYYINVNATSSINKGSIFQYFLAR